jgi:tetratricopeptide (TPR) repeat protein
MYWWLEAVAQGGKGEYEQALALLENTISTTARIDEVLFRARSLNTIGWVYSELQDHQRAMEWNTRGLEVSQELETPDIEVSCNTILNIGDNLMALGQLDEAEERFQEVEQVSALIPQLW